jgi:hypothetical protein
LALLIPAPAERQPRLALKQRHTVPPIRRENLLSSEFLAVRAEAHQTLGYKMIPKTRIPRL